MLSYLPCESTVLVAILLTLMGLLLDRDDAQKIAKTGLLDPGDGVDHMLAK